MKTALFRWIANNKAIFLNAGSLIGTWGVTSGLGFVYWWLAARVFVPQEVGIGSAAISVMTLLGTICMMGLGTLLITELPRQRENAGSLLSTSLIVVAVQHASTAYTPRLIRVLSLRAVAHALGIFTGTFLYALLAIRTVDRAALDYSMTQDSVTDGLESLVASGRSLDDALSFLPSVAATAQAAGADITDIATTAELSPR